LVSSNNSVHASCKCFDDYASDKIVRKRIPKWRSVVFLLLWPNGWMDQDATWKRGRPQPRPHCVRWDPDPQQFLSAYFLMQ